MNTSPKRDSDGPVEILDTDGCWELLHRSQLGRLATTVQGEVDIFPVNYAVHDRALYFRTAPGSKLFELSVNPHVAFEVDEHDDHSAGSVVVKGTAERIERQDEIDIADSLDLVPWIPTLKYRWVRIVPETLTGRRFSRGAEPDRYAVIEP